MHSTPAPAPLTPALRLLAAAPHRLLFFAGAANLLLAALWWALWLIDARWHLFDLAPPSLPAGWMHAFIMQYQVLPTFMFGFLLTVFPRWMNQPALSRSRYILVGGALMLGQLLTLIGLAGNAVFFHVGAISTLVGWTAGTCLLAGVIWKETGITWHAISCLIALVLGLCGLLLYAAFLHLGDARWMFASIKLGSFGLLLPIFFTVCHRMIPFFAGSVVPGYALHRPMWALALFWLLIVAHLACEMTHAYAMLWIADVPMALLTGWLLWQWWPRTKVIPPLLQVLFVGFTWLPIAFALYAGQSLGFEFTGNYALGRAPAHALFIGYFSSLLVAMVTRVTQGHSGRPLILGGVAACAFVCIQLVAVLRIAAEIATDSYAVLAIAASGWVLAFIPWVLRSTWIYLTPRVDHKPG